LCSCVCVFVCVMFTVLFFCRRVGKYVASKLTISCLFRTHLLCLYVCVFLLLCGTVCYSVCVSDSCANLLYCITRDNRIRSKIQ